MATEYGFGKIVTDGLVLALNAADVNSYSGSGTVWRDLSGNNNNGTLTNGPTFSSANGGSIVFDGTNDFVNLGTPQTLTGLQVPLTIITWAIADTFSNYNTLYGAYANTTANQLYSMLRVDFGVLKYYASTVGSFQSQGSFTPFLNRWNFYAVTVSGTLSSPTVTIYLNTLSQTFSYAAFTTTPDLAVSLRIAGNQATVNEYWDGNISNIQIYNRALSATEILQNYNAQRSRFGL